MSGGTTRKLAQLNHLKAEYGDQLWLASLDVTDTLAVRTVVDAAFGHFSRIDVILNNAGYGLVGAAEELTDDQIIHQIDMNLMGSIQVIRVALPHLRVQCGGRILQMSSVGGQMAAPGMSVYHAGKWGIEGFLEAIAQEIAPFNIETTIVEPGGGPTAIFDAGRLVHGPALLPGRPENSLRAPHMFLPGIQLK